jgi:hypothetical protein
MQSLGMVVTVASRTLHEMREGMRHPTRKKKNLKTQVPQTGTRGTRHVVFVVIEVESKARV